MRTAGLIGVALAVSSCTAFTESGSSSPDAWFRASPAELRQEWEALPREDVHPVLPEKREAAIALLDSHAAVPVSPEQVRELAGIQADSGHWFVVRGLCAGCKTGRFNVHQSQGRILVHHASLASRPVPVTRWPVVVALDEEPVEVYVSASSVK